MRHIDARPDRHRQTPDEQADHNIRQNNPYAGNPFIREESVAGQQSRHQQRDNDNRQNLTAQQGYVDVIPVDNIRNEAYPENCHDHNKHCDYCKRDSPGSYHRAVFRENTFQRACFPRADQHHNAELKPRQQQPDKDGEQTVTIAGKPSPLVRRRPDQHPCQNGEGDPSRNCPTVVEDGFQTGQLLPPDQAGQIQNGSQNHRRDHQQPLQGEPERQGIPGFRRDQRQPDGCRQCFNAG